MAYYNRRDILAHWVARDQAADRACAHACCRGYRVHPKHGEVILPARRLHGATDDQLAAYFEQYSFRGTKQSQRREAQVLHEMDRRDRLQRRREERASAVQLNRAVRRSERDAETRRIRMEAEEATKGYLVNREGSARGISDSEILYGREAVFQRYASSEARAYFAEHPRPTGAYFRGKDTRIQYSDRPTRRPAVAGYRARSSRRGPVQEFATVRRAEA